MLPLVWGELFKELFPAPKQKVGLVGVFPSCASCRILDSINWVSKLYSFTIHGGEDPQNSTDKSQAAASTLVHPDDSSLCGCPQGCHVELPPPPITSSAPPRLYLLFWQYLETRGRHQEKERKSCQRLSCGSLLIKFIRLTSLSIF